MSDTAHRIAALSPEQREALQRKLAERSGERRSSRREEPRLAAAPVDAAAPVPLTDAQEAFWAGRSGLFDLGGSGANVYLEYEFPGALWSFAGTLEEAVRRVVERHEMLRTVILPDGTQRLLAAVDPFQVEAEDLSRLSQEAAEERLRAVREELRYDRGAAGAWPLFDIVLHQLQGGTIRLHARFDALLIDGTSRGVLIDEVLRLLADPEAELAPAEVSFLDYARSLAAFRESGAYREDREYWMARVPRLPPAPALPLVRALSPADTPRIIKRRVPMLDPRDWTALKGRTARLGITPTALLTAAFAEALRPWSGSDTFTLGIIGSLYPPIHPRVRQILGTFNTLHLLEVEACRGSFEERARRLQTRMSADLDHPYFTGHRVLREINRRRGAGVRATLPVLFDSVVELGNRGPDARAEEPAETAGDRRAPMRMTEVDLRITLPQVLLFTVVIEGDDGSLFVIEQAVEEVLAPGLVDRLLETYRDLLERLARKDAAWAERGPARAPVPPWPIPRSRPGAGTERTDLRALFLERAGAQRDAVGLVTQDGIWTYGALARGDGGGAAAEVTRLGGLLDARDDAASRTVMKLLDRLRVASGDAVLATSPFDSDLALMETAGVLASGATLVLPRVGAPPAALAELARQGRTTHWSGAAPRIERVLTALERSGGLPPLRAVCLHRERIPGSLPGRLRAHWPGILLLAAWGDAAAPVAAAVSELDGELEAGAVVLEEPVSDTVLEVLDATGHPRPPGVADRLFVRRAAVEAPGAESAPVETSWRARALGDGRVVVLGRQEAPTAAALGYGTELGWVEDALESHPSVGQAVVVWRERAEASAGRGVLTAFVALRPEGPASGDLRRHLEERLPLHLVPETIVPLESLPLTPAGAVDLSALPLVAEPRGRPVTGDGADPVAVQVAGLWEEVLGHRPVQDTDDFFALGGDSLAAVRLLSRLELAWGQPIPAFELFARPTVAGHAAALRRGIESKPGRPVRRLRSWLRGLKTRIAGHGSTEARKGD